LHDGDAPALARANELLAEVSRELRQVTRELHPSVLDEAGLAAAVQTLAETLGLQHRFTRCDKWGYDRRHDRL
jgi:two-component system, NarL family, sensor kinase